MDESAGPESIATVTDVTSVKVIETTGVQDDAGIPDDKDSMVTNVEVIQDTTEEADTADTGDAAETLDPLDP